LTATPTVVTRPVNREIHDPSGSVRHSDGTEQDVPFFFDEDRRRLGDRRAAEPDADEVQAPGRSPSR
jgi:hypothetical protein